MLRSFFLIAIFGLFAASAGAQALGVGSTLDGFSMPDTNGTVQTLESVKGANGTVLIFVSNQCPVVRDYNDRMNALYADFKAKGVNVVGINSNFTESADAVKAHAAATYKFPVLKDVNNAFADRLNANSTPEVFFLDAKNKIVYHGAIDNNRRGDNITEAYARLALDAVLNGKEVAKANTTPVGCSIKKVDKARQ